MENSNKKIDFKIVKTPTNYFQLTILTLLSIGVGFLMYLSWTITMINFEELQSTIPFQFSPKKAVLSLTVPKTEYQIGEMIDVKTSLEIKKGKIQGVDLLIKYDPNFLIPLTVSGQKEDLAKETGSIRVDPLKYLDTQETSFDIFPFLTINEKSGLISFSALTKPLQELSGDIVICSLKFLAIKNGETSLDIVFEKGKTEESNVASSGRDILENVKNLNLIIK